MNGHRTRLLVGGLAALALIAAACAPAAEPAPAAPQQQTQQPAAQQPVTQQQKPAAEQPKPAEQAKPKTSVSGIPLDSNAKFGGVLVLPYTEEGPTTSNWEEAAGVASQAVHPQVNALIQHKTWYITGDSKDMEAYWELHPDLATSWEQSKDGMKWNFKLRSGVKWSDGTPFTCKDTKWSFDAIRTGEGLKRSPRAIHLVAIDNIQCPDDLTMVVNLKYPKASLPDMLALPYNVIFPAHVYAKNTDKMREDPYKVGTGPFKLVEWLAGEKYRFEKKKDYWDQPFPYLDGIELRFMTTAATTTAIRAGRVESVGQFTGAQANQLIKECDLCDSTTWQRYIHMGFSPIMVNHQRPPWNTKEIMDAISLAIDRTKVTQVAQQGWAEPPRGGLFPSTTFWALPYERTKQVPGYNFEDPASNMAKAKEVLQKAGYRPGELVISLTAWNNTSTMANVVPITEDLTAAGFKVEVKPQETARAYDAMSAGDFSVHIHGFFVSDRDPDLMLYEHFYTGSDRNYGRYSKPEVDRLIDEMSRTADLTLRRERAWNVQEILLKDHAKHIIQWAAYQPMFSKKIRGILPGNLASWTYGSYRRHAHTWLTGS